MPLIFLTKLPFLAGQQALLDAAHANSQDVTILEIQESDASAISLPNHPSLRLLEGYFHPEPLHQWARALLAQTQPGDEILLAESEFLHAHFARAH
jgi:hypothetical protein